MSLNIKKTAIFSLILFFSSFVFLSANAQNNSPADPEILSTEQSASKNELAIKGRADSGSFVHIYIDGVYNGKTDILAGDAAKADFSYRPYFNLSSGDHSVWAVAENEAGEKSGLSNIFKFKIKPGVPAPTLFSPVMYNNSSHPFIIGVAKNDLTIKIYINDKYDGEFKVTNNESGTANFSYQVSRSLKSGAHTAYAIAADFQEKESGRSNIINFQTADLYISDEKIMNLNKEETVSDADEKNVIEQPEIKDGQITDKNGDEDANKKNISPGAAIFILFLIGIIGWIIWVNRALIKEKMGRDGGAKNSPKSK